MSGGLLLDQGNGLLGAGGRGGQQIGPQVVFGVLVEYPQLVLIRELENGGREAYTQRVALAQV